MDFQGVSNEMRLKPQKINGITIECHNLLEVVLKREVEYTHCHIQMQNDKPSMILFKIEKKKMTCARAQWPSDRHKIKLYIYIYIRERVV